MLFFMRVDLFSTTTTKPSTTTSLESTSFLSLPPIFVLDEPEAQTNQPPVPQSDSPSDSFLSVAPVPLLIPPPDTSVSNLIEPFSLSLQSSFHKSSYFSTSGQYF